MQKKWLEHFCKYRHIYRIYACFSLGLLEMPETPVFSRAYRLWVKMQRYRILSENGVV